jgi:hypothetical protein
MGVPILICECGLRVKAPGATPGRVGRCPNCGGPLKMPEVASPRQVSVKEEGTAGEPGYHLDPVKEASLLVPSRSRPIPGGPSRAVFTERKRTTPAADGLLPVLDRPETNWFVSILYPLRGADSLGVIATTSVVLWFFTILVPEYCFTLMADADSMGAALLGNLIALISILPFVLLFPLLIFYCLQYLGRTMVSSAMGETRPPRTPDRNFDGFFNGMSPWLIWLVLGVFVGVLPLFLYIYTASTRGDVNVVVAIGLLLVGLPYVVIAMMMSFLHDHALAANPLSVFGAIVRLGLSYWLLCVFVAAAVTLALGFFAAVWLLRANHVGIYILFALVAWVVIQWALIVVMRVLGIYYYRHRDRLRWHHERPRWGVAWRL